MILVVDASSLYHSLKTLDSKDRVTVDEHVYSSPGLNLDPNTSNWVSDYLKENASRKKLSITARVSSGFQCPTIIIATRLCL